MYFRMKSMVQEIEQRDLRIQNLSDMLQVAEYSTGVPYYSCVNQTQFPNETPGWMYGRIREEILRRGVRGDISPLLNPPNAPKLP